MESLIEKQEQQKEKLLIVDDNYSDLALCESNILNSSLASRFEVVTADSYEQALDLFNTISFTCCLVDYNLPTNSGMDFLKAATRAHGNTAAIIMMTGVGDERLAADVMRNGAHDYLIKGDLTPDTLSQSISSAIYTCELQSRLRYLAHYDNLTGLLNRSLFMDRVKTAIGQCERYQHSCSLLYIDVDNFKHINDQYGHEAGDSLLREVGKRIKNSCRTSDSPCRLGGDEFAILLTHINTQDTQSTAVKILEKVSQPITLESHRLQVSLSIGIAHYPDTATTMQELMRQADEAMYKAKKTGKAKYYQFTPSQRQLWQKRNQLESLLPKAIEKNELELIFQPIIDAHTKELHSLTVYAQWRLTEETITNDALIEMLKRLGLMDSFHVWFIDRALAQFSQWKNSHPDLNVCLNLPVDQCHSPLLLASLKESLQTYNVKAQQIELEITETTLMKHPTISHERLLAIGEEGIRIAISDFGSGYSSMAHLSTLPLNSVKIDQHFLADIESNRSNRKIIKAIAALSHSLELKVVAQGVTTEQQLQIAKDADCDLIQGFHVAKPVSEQDNGLSFISQFPNLSSISDKKQSNVV